MTTPDPHRSRNLRIVGAWLDGRTQAQIAREYRVSPMTVRRVLVAVKLIRGDMRRRENM